MLKITPSQFEIEISDCEEKNKNKNYEKGVRNLWWEKMDDVSRLLSNFDWNSQEITRLLVHLSPTIGKNNWITDEDIDKYVKMCHPGKHRGKLPKSNCVAVNT